MNKKQQITIAVSGINNTDNPGPGIPVIRGLKESELFEPRIIGFAYENLEPGMYMQDMMDHCYILPYPSVGQGIYMNRILQIHQQDPIDIIIPNLDAELYTFIKSEKLLLENNIHCFLPTLAQFEERNKGNLFNYGMKYGVKVPESILLITPDDIRQNEDKITYPILVKGKFYDAYKAYNAEQVTEYFHKISAKWGLPVILQKFITGTEVNVVALGDGTGNTIAAVPMRKQYITDKGKAWGGVTLNDPQLLDITYNLISQTKWRGGMELEMIRTKEDDYFLIEINPRIPAWVYLAVAAGQNIPEALALLALGNKVDTMTTYEVGKLFIRYSWDLIADMKDLEKITMNGEFEIGTRRREKG